VSHLSITATDGTRLYAEVHGKAIGDAPVLVMNDGIGCDGFIWKYLLPAFQDEFAIVRWHYRGHGRSDNAPSLNSYRIHDNILDLEAVLDAVEVENAILMGHSMGVQVSLESALSLRSRVRGLVLLCGSYGRPLDTFRNINNTAAASTAVPILRRLVDRYGARWQKLAQRLMPTQLGWMLAQLLEVDGRMLRREDFIPYLQHLSAMDPAVFLAMLEDAGNHTTEDRLPQIDVPTLILAGEKDHFTPSWVSEVMETRIPKSEMHMIRGGTHTAPLEHSDLTILLIQDWLRRNPGTIGA
jgi:pimeloyl-ACP methyl ester carboxylesterase